MCSTPIESNGTHLYAIYVHAYIYAYTERQPCTRVQLHRQYELAGIFIKRIYGAEKFPINRDRRDASHRYCNFLVSIVLAFDNASVVLYVR